VTTSVATNEGLRNFASYPRKRPLVSWAHGPGGEGRVFHGRKKLREIWGQL
jgi:hypothetical protein